MARAQPPRVAELIVTAACSRCDEALDALLSMAELRGATLKTREVLADDALFERYQARVPVLRIGGEELDWPFDGDRVRRALRGAAPPPR